MGWANLVWFAQILCPKFMLENVKTFQGWKPFFSKSSEKLQYYPNFFQLTRYPWDEI